MAVGETTSGTLGDALPEVVSDARIVREYAGTWKRTCDVRKQEEGTGLAWTQFQLAQLDAQDIQENAENRNFQQLAGSLLTTEPVMSQIIIKITDRTYRKVAKVVSSKFGTLAGNAMARKKDEDYISLFATFATTASPGTGNPLSHGHIAAAARNASSNATEPAMSSVYSVLHGFQIYDLQLEVLAPVGTYEVTGMSETVYRQGWRGSVAGSDVFEDGNISPTAISSTNGRGATHAREGVIAVMGMDIKEERDRDIYFGGGADVISLVDEYSFVENTSRGTQVFCYAHVSDTTAPAA
jgi:hypothetical protein